MPPSKPTESSTLDDSDDLDFGGQLISKRPKLSFLFRSPKLLAIEKLGGHHEPFEQDADELDQDHASQVEG